MNTTIKALAVSGTFALLWSSAAMSTDFLPGSDTPPAVIELEVSPAEVFLLVGESQQLTVIGHFADGTDRDVTIETSLLSSLVLRLGETLRALRMVSWSA